MNALARERKEREENDIRMFKCFFKFKLGFINTSQ